MEAVIDLDGTLSDNSHRKHLIEGENKKWREYLRKCSEDKPIKEVIKFVKELESDHNIVIITARSEEVRKETKKWLKDNNIPYDQLLMLQKGNWAIEDHDYKREKLEKLENPVIAIDDKKSNCQIFEKHGLETYTVKNLKPVKFS